MRRGKRGRQIKNVHHFIFATKYRRPILVPEVFEEVKKHVYRIAYLKGIVIEDINTDPDKPDHIHILADLPKDMPPSEAMRLIKWYSSKYTRKKFPHFRWQVRYFSRSVGGGKQRVKRYIQDQ